MPKKADSQEKPRWRVVHDCRKLNKVTKEMVYPLPQITRIFDNIGSSKYFTTLDLASGFLQIKMAEKDKEKTAFCTEHGKFEFNFMPFGLMNAPKTFQAAMDRCLDGLIGHGVFCYMDDVIIYAKTLEEHNEIFDRVMQRLRKYNLKIQIDKCRFLLNKVTFLGHELSEEGIKPDSR